MSDRPLLNVPYARLATPQSNTPNLDALVGRVTETELEDDSCAVLRKKTNQGLSSPHMFPDMLMLALKDDLRDIKDRLGKDARNKMIGRVFKSLGTPQEEVAPADLSRLRDIVSAEKAKEKATRPRGESALTKWSRAQQKLPKNRFDVLAYDHTTALKQKLARPLQEALLEDIETRLPDYPPILHGWVRNKVLELTGGEPYLYGPAQSKELEAHLETVVQWIRSKFGETAGPKGDNYKLSDRKDTYWLDRHWAAQLELDELKQRASVPGGIAIDEALQLYKSAKEQLGGSVRSNELRAISWAVGGLSYFCRNKALAKLEERLRNDPSGHWTDPEVLAFAMERFENARGSLSPAKTITSPELVEKVKRDFEHLQERYNVDLRGLSPLDFVGTGKVDTPHKLEYLINEVYR